MITTEMINKYLNDIYPNRIWSFHGLEYFVNSDKDYIVVFFLMILQLKKMIKLKLIGKVDLYYIKKIYLNI